MTRITASTYQEWADELNKLEDQVQAIQDAKKAVYARIRRDHSKLVADGMKSAMRLLRMEERKRAEAMLIEAEGRRIIELINSGGHAGSRAAREDDSITEPPEDWRDLRARERAEPFPPANNAVESSAPPHDPETGEILEEVQEHSQPEQKRTFAADNSNVQDDCVHDDAEADDVEQVA